MHIYAPLIEPKCKKSYYTRTVLLIAECTHEIPRAGGPPPIDPELQSPTTPGQYYL